MTPRDLLREYAKAYCAYMDIMATPAPSMYEHVIELEARLLKLMETHDEHG